jgi:hypothetical protein
MISLFCNRNVLKIKALCFYKVKYLTASIKLLLGVTTRVRLSHSLFFAPLKLHKKRAQTIAPSFTHWFHEVSFDRIETMSPA